MTDDRKSSRVRSKSRTRWRKVRSSERGITRIDEDNEFSTDQFQIFERIVTPELKAERIRNQKSPTPKIFSLSKLVRTLNVK